MMTKRAHTKDKTETHHGASQTTMSATDARGKSMPANGHRIQEKQPAEPTPVESRKATKGPKSKRPVTKDSTKKTPPRNKGLRFPEIHTALGEVLRTYRRQLNISQSDIGMDADLDRAYLSRVERAEQSPTVATLLAIAEKLGVPASQLLLEAEERVSRKPRGSKL